MNSILSVGILPVSNFLEVDRLIESQKFIRLDGLLVRFFGFKHAWQIDVVSNSPGGETRTIHVAKSHAFLNVDRKLVRVKTLKPGDHLIGDVSGRTFEVRSVCRGPYVPVAEVATSSPSSWYSIDGLISGNMTTHRKHLTISSYGIMIFRVRPNGPEILLVQNRHSWTMLDLLRGKFYNQGPLRDIARVFLTEITEEERHLLRTKTFRDLWRDMDWPVDDLHLEDRLSPFLKAEAKFRELDVQSILDELPTSRYGPIMGPPKGRMAGVKEAPIDTAKREVLEETGLCEADYEVISTDPILESHLATNGVRYKNQFFLAKLKRQDVNQVTQQTDREISHSIWVSKDQALSLLRDYEDAKRSAILAGFDQFERHLTQN